VFRGNFARAASTLCTVSVLSAAAATGAAAHPFSAWSGKSGPFRWQAERISCGEVTGEPKRVHAHTRWVKSPANSYQRVRFVRQIWDETATAWTTVDRQTRTTKNTPFEGTDAILHWTQFFQPSAGEEGKTSRDVLFFAWRRDRNGLDRTIFSRRLVLAPCVVGA
jgi:hypothetical protein